MKLIKIYTNEVRGGWSCNDLDYCLGGSEECVVLLAEELVRQGYQVKVYHTKSEGANSVRKGVNYHSREQFNNNEYCDVLIIFKDTELAQQRNNAGKVLFWSSEVNTPFNLEHVDYYIALTRYHAQRSIWVDCSKLRIIQHGIDLYSLNKAGYERDKGTLLYCSSPDRGLINLLRDWRQIKKNNPDLKLRIAYGFDNFDKVSGNQNYKNQILELCSQDDVYFLGSLSKAEIERAYWRAEYWVLPLQVPDSELFCLNAVKSQHCGCKPIVNLKGALQNTVDKYIDYKTLLNANIDSVEMTQNKEHSVPAMDWQEVFTRFWLKLI